MVNLLDIYQKPIDSSYKEHIIASAKRVAMYFGDEYIYRDRNGKYFEYKDYSICIKYEIIDGNPHILINDDKTEVFNSNKNTYHPGSWENKLSFINQRCDEKYSNEKMSDKIAFCGNFLCSKLGETGYGYPIVENVTIDIFLYEKELFLDKVENQVIFEVFVDKDLVFKSENTFNLNKVDFNNIAHYYRIRKYVPGDWEQKIIGYTVPLLDQEVRGKENENAALVNNGIKRVRRSGI